MRQTTAARVFIIASIALPWTLAAQTPQPSFEVASIKASKGGDHEGRSGALEPGGRFTVTGITLRDVIGFAYANGGRPRNGSEISGGPVSVLIIDRADHPTEN